MRVQFVISVCVVAANAGFIQTSYYDEPQEHIPIIKNGVPVETPEVQLAKAQHFDAYARAAALAAQDPSDGQYHEEQRHYFPAEYTTGTGFHHYRRRRGIYHFSQEQHIPIITKNGVPEETPEVKVAKLQHFIAHSSVHEHEPEEYYYNDETSYNHNDYPVITKHGVPEDTPEVKAARQQHLIAHSYAKSGSLYGEGYSHHVPVIGPNGVPYDTPEVQIAKQQHLTAHAQETAEHNQWSLNSGYGSEYSHYY